MPWCGGVLAFYAVDLVPMTLNHPFQSHLPVPLPLPKMTGSKALCSGKRADLPTIRDAKSSSAKRDLSDLAISSSEVVNHPSWPEID